MLCTADGGDEKDDEAPMGCARKDSGPEYRKNMQVVRIIPMNNPNQNPLFPPFELP
jgi:hypothetical protein